MKNTSSIFKAVREGNISQTEAALKECPELSNATIPGDSSILDSKIWKNLEIVPVEPAEKPYGMALDYCALWGKVELARLLLEHGADVNALAYENNHGQTPPVMLAAWEGGLDVPKLLIENGADANAVSSNGVTPLSTAKKHGKLDRVDLLKQFGAMR